MESIWITGKRFFGNQFSTLDSPGDHHQGIHPCAPQRERGSVPQATGSGTRFAGDDKQNRGHLQKGRRLRVRQYGWSFRRILWLESKDFKYRNCNSTNSVIHNHSSFGKYDSKIKRLAVLIFHRKQCYGSTEWRWLILWTN